MNNRIFLNAEFLEKRIETFYGYGNYKGNYWFIGMEEAGDGSFKDTDERINLWVERGQEEIEDVAEYHIAMGCWDKKIQPTWKGLIRIVLSAKGKENITPDDVREYQFNELGRKDKETCLLELLPLPSPSINHWLYSEHSDLTKLPFLSDRDTYKKHCIEKRIDNISQRIKAYQPKAVILYGMGYEYYWRQIADVEFTKIDYSKKEYFFIGRNNQTVFIIAKHSVAFGTTNDYFHYIGKSITAKLAEKSFYP
ncbi:hypothetical protein VB713_11290 [Anabaena cylindrica UHCC 0172]|uniref:hypothetical protein n=1 Tax=Anabaena cylindrica TaxID=1165 RepID=UPI002B208C3F|nr:hypothetical protein [Anabaena cylindrica]MEA5551557.1 hypothetical protein [Anabaena cylindrica UHCC 0172]